MAFIVAAIAFLVIVGLVLATYSALTTESPVTRRVRRLLPAAPSTPPPHKPTSGPGFLRHIVIGLGEFVVGRPDTSASHALSAAGIRGRNAVAVFVGIRTLLSFGPALAMLVSQVAAGQPLIRAFWTAGLAGLLGHLIANYWLRRRGRFRIQQLTESLPDTLDLMVVCLESGLGLNATIARVGDERSALNDPLGQEFAQVALDLRNGRNREDALRSLGDRNGVEDLKALAGLVIQSDRLGASLGKTLRAHADLLRTKRRQRAEEAARKLPIKVLFPLATMMLPPLFVIIVGPAFLKLQDLVKSVTSR